MHMRSFVVIRSARVLAISKYWDIIENNWWGQRQKLARVNDLESAEKRKKKAAKTKKDEPNGQRISK